MTHFNPRLVPEDLDLYLNDLIFLGENPHTLRFWDYLRYFIASLADTPERMELLHWWMARKKHYMGE
jgi:hypothetical protein